MNEREFNVEDARLDVLVHQENVAEARQALEAVRKRLEATAIARIAEAQGVLNRELLWLESAKARHAAAKHALDNFAD